MKKVLMVLFVVVFLPMILAQDVPKKQDTITQQQIQQQQQDLNKIYKKQIVKLDSILKAKKDTVK